MPVLLLLAAAAGIFYWKRRKVGLGKHIRIIETASLGPKRALILAEVNGTTMVIGTSEAGISLLSRLPDGAERAPASTAVRVPSLAIDDDDDEPSLTANEQGGALARLFGRRAPAPEGEATPQTFFDGHPDGDDDPFAAVLRDSVEDQELRVRLSSGFNVKVT